MRTLAVVAAVVALLLGPLPAHAQAPCGFNAVTQQDMAGVYVSPESMMRVEMFGCGGTAILWDNQFGRHAAAYVSRERLSGGGILAGGMTPDPVVGYLDGAVIIGLKPAEAGYLQVVTTSPYGSITGVYRLRKID